ncbi:MAG: Holliday junction branch migration protein RuvA [Tepidisphaeraceae bacterium]|jgi:Holliday junction DNA helicase RuvA
MISAITGDLKKVDEDRVHLQAGPMTYELLVPAADAADLQSSVGQQMTFHTLCYLEGDPTRGNMQPRLIGFLRPADKRFFERFTTVKGIGPKTALKALTMPVGQIAQAIEEKNTRFLTELKGVGKRTAELIVAELAGKVKDFATGVGTKSATALTPRPDHEEYAIAGLVALGEPRAIAERLLERVKQNKPTLKTAGELIREMLSLRAA